MKHLKAFKENKSDNNYEMKGKSENFQDFFHDLSDEFNVGSMYNILWFSIIFL